MWQINSNIKVKSINFPKSPPPCIYSLEQLICETGVIVQWVGRVLAFNCPGFFFQHPIWPPEPIRSDLKANSQELSPEYHWV